MYPGPDAPDLGTFVAQVERELEARGHEVELAVLDTRAGGKLRYLTLAREDARREPARRGLRALPRSLRADRGARGWRAARGHRAREGRPQHRRDPGDRPGDPARRAARSGGDLRLRLPAPRARDEAARGARQGRGRLERRRPRALRGHRAAAQRARPASSASARSTSGRTSSASPTPSHASARERSPSPATGRCRPQLEGRERVRLLGRVPHDEIPRLLSESRVLAQPSLVEPLGQALLEAMACGRSVVATRIGGPPEFVPPEAGVLVDPLDVDALARGARRGRGAAVPERRRPRGDRRARRPPPGRADRGDPQPGALARDPRA